ncbi:hypothetical protein [Corynebacterium vitaeruminis]|uniref:hypothetical protein n=1 Tax=Corynebacterium vitaeruminis TaxID=38305 RepID=UPI0023F53CA0|nr:hypothetical protein [Corynebacterium vitaeruminis]
MIQPIRIVGAEIPTPAIDAVTLDPTSEGGRHITYVSPSGESWVLQAPTVEEVEQQRVVLKPDCTDGWSVKPEFTEKESVTQFGARTVGFKLPAFDASMDFTVTSDFQFCAFEERNWRAAWSPFKAGKLISVARDGSTRWAPVTLNSMADLPHDLMGCSYYEGSLSFRQRAGCWLGQAESWSGGDTQVTVSVKVPGDVTPSVRMIWDTSKDASFTFPSGTVVNLYRPAVADGVRYINLDRGMYGQVTRLDGSVDSTMWSSFLGRVSGVTLSPDVATTWKLQGGVTLEVTPRFLSPWG